MKKTFQITEIGKKELEQELEELKGRRGEIADKIAEARDYGDLSENAEYDSAREEQGLVETRVAEIEDILANAEIIKAKRSDKVHVGSTVEVEVDGGRKVTYMIVGPVEADPTHGKISDESPIGESLLGKGIGEKASYRTPRGDMIATIVSIS